MSKRKGRGRRLGVGATTDLMPPVVIPLRDNAAEREDYSLLRYSVRAWCKRYPGVRIIVVGGRPSWWAGEHFPAEQPDDNARRAFRNFPNILRSILENIDTEEFILSDDDHFPMRLAPWPPYPTYCRDVDLDEYCRRMVRWSAGSMPGSFEYWYAAGIIGQRNILRDWGIDTQDLADNHVPHQLERTKLAALLDKVAREYPRHQLGHFRILYGALFGRNLTRIPDPKVMDIGPAGAIGLDRRQWVSTSPASWRIGHLGVALREMYNRPSPYERQR